MGSKSELRPAIILFCVCCAALARAQTLATLSESFRDLAKRVHPSVVKVTATGFRAIDEDDELAEPGVLIRQQSSGSGVIIDAAGYIVTNAHVVSGARKIQITLAPPRDDSRRSAVRPGGRVLRAELIGLDFETDVAVLRVASGGLAALPLADSDQIEQGQVVLAFGSPLGLDNSVSFGIVSSTARQLKPDDPMIYIQTDAPINPGSSGGPLVDTEGRVVGISTLILSQSGGNEGLGFAIPSNIVSNIVGQLRTSGRVVRGEVGLRVQTITPTLASAWRLSQEWGVVVSDVEPETAAEKAGIRPGDVIRTLNGKTMENARQFNVNVYSPPIGSVIELDIDRDNRKVKAALKVAERKSEPEQLAALAGRDENLVPELGVFVLDFTDKLRERLGTPRSDAGVLIASRLEDSPLFDDSLKAGDLICAINREAVRSVAGLKASLKRLKPGDAVALQIERQGRLSFVAFELP